MSQYYTLGNLKYQLRETTSDNDNNLNTYGKQADSIINRKLSNIEPQVLQLGSLTLPPQDLKDLSDSIAIGLFYFIENGDDALFKYAISQLDDYIESRYHRPQAITAGAR